MAHQYIFTMKDLRKIVPPKREILKGIWLSFFPGAKIGVLGANGAGKSTLLRIMAGVDKDFLGEAWPADGVRIGYLPQEPQLDPAKDVRGNVEEGVAEVRGAAHPLRRDQRQARRADRRRRDGEAPRAEQARVQDAIDAANGWELDRTVEIAMDALRCPPGDADVATLSGGERRRVALCRLLLQKPDLLLLDEPTNHLDAESVAWLERFLKEYPGTVVAVTHDRYFLDNVAGWILELDRGAGIPWEGNYSSWLEQKKQRLAVGGEAGVRAPAHARARARVGAHVAARAPGQEQGAPAGLRDSCSPRAASEREGAGRDRHPAGPAAGRPGRRGRGPRKGYGDRLLIEDLTFSLPRGGIVGVIGPNGAGKTTLFRMITGQEKPDARRAARRARRCSSPTWTRAATRSIRTRTSGRRSPAAPSSSSSAARQMASRAYVAAFNFKGADQQKKVGDLSGGERNRVHLAKLLKSGGNLLLLDEPTNDLDVDTLRALEDALLAFAGCAVVISHDRWFLDRIATHMLAFEGDSRVVWFEGNYQDYEADRQEAPGRGGRQPHRIRYKPLTRG